MLSIRSMEKLKIKNSVRLPRKEKAEKMKSEKINRSIARWRTEKK